LAQIIAIINFKGGIAKTTTAIHLGASLALLKYKVLILDYDPQTSLSIGYKVKKDNQYTINDLLVKMVLGLPKKTKIYMYYQEQERSFQGLGI